MSEEQKKIIDTDTLEWASFDQDGNRVERENVKYWAYSIPFDEFMSSQSATQDAEPVQPIQDSKEDR